MWIKKVNPIASLDIERRCFMIFPILQAIWQQFGPQIQQAVQQVGQQLGPHIVNNRQQLMVPTRLATGYLIENMSKELQSLSDEDKQKLKRAGVWLLKDMGGDVAAAATGLPIGLLVDLGLEKLFPDENGQK
jgi:hypothetical protein